MTKRVGRQTVAFSKPIVIRAAASTVGKKEGEGPLGKYFDEIAEDSMMGEDSWEKAESCFVAENMALVLKKAGLSHEDIQYVLCGDLLNQCIGTTFGVKDLHIPFLGLFGACSTMGEAMSVGAMLIDGGAVQRRDGRRPAGHDVQPFLRGRKAVSISAAIRHPASSISYKNCHRRRCSGSGERGRGAANHHGHHRENH